MIDRLAKQQACQLFIEQEIAKGIAAGKSEYGIGKEIAVWIKKLFEADIKPHTITVRAHRMEEELVTNVTNDSTQQNQTETQEIQDEPQHGGAREGAGRPTKFADTGKEQKTPVLGPPRIAMQFARIAIMKLEEIKEDDAERDQAFNSIRSYLSVRSGAGPEVEDPVSVETDMVTDLTRIKLNWRSLKKSDRQEFLKWLRSDLEEYFFREHKKLKEDRKATKGYYQLELDRLEDQRNELNHLSNTELD